MGLVKILESRGVNPREDVARALTASKDGMFPGQQSELYAPQLVHAAQWAEANISSSGDDEVLLMGWASLGKRALGAPILGMFVVSNTKFCFVRKGTGGGEGDAEQVYNIGKITNAKQSGMLGLRKVSFVASEDGKAHTLERVQKDNAKMICMYVKKSGSISCKAHSFIKGSVGQNASAQ